MPASAQSPLRNGYYSRPNSFGLLLGYSGDSSHIVIGNAERRKLLLIGVSYNRRLTLGHSVNWQYSAEFEPVALESDPLSVFVNNQTLPTKGTFVSPGGPTYSCTPMTVDYNFPGPDGESYAGTATTYCHGRRWTMGEAMSPVGFQWNFRPTHKLQPLIAGHGGYMFSTREIPMPGAGSFNFTFDLGAGLELYRSPTRSIRFDYRYHHISNDHTAAVNPGIDNGLFQVTYSFGR
ncbi:MAG TPA: acyloxyacyl hydrolase [Terracidiphilus sp.]|nr:acyloxyacyl hydrolase [Terracidiphilus sp.]